MTTLNYSIGDRVQFKYTDGSYIHEGVIDIVDTVDKSLPYHVTSDNNESFWFSEAEIVSKVGSGLDDQMSRIEAKLDAIIAHFNVPFEA